MVNSIQNLCHNTLKNLHDATGDVFYEILTIYIDGAITNINALKLALKENDTDQLLRLAHTLKGSSRNVGASKTAQLCESFEKILRDNEQCDFQNHIDLIQSSYETSLPLLRKYLNH